MVDPPPKPDARNQEERPCDFRLGAAPSLRSSMALPLEDFTAAVPFRPRPDMQLRHLLSAVLVGEMSVNSLDHVGARVSNPFADCEEINPTHDRLADEVVAQSIGRYGGKTSLSFCSIKRLAKSSCTLLRASRLNKYPVMRLVHTLELLIPFPLPVHKRRLELRVDLDHPKSTRFRLVMLLWADEDTILNEVDISPLQMGALVRAGTRVRRNHDPCNELPTSLCCRRFGDKSPELLVSGDAFVPFDLP